MFPDKDSQEKAEVALRDDFLITSSSKTSSKLMPKLKIHDLEGYDKDDKPALRDAILQKNPTIRQLINDYNGKKNFGSPFRRCSKTFWYSKSFS